MTELTCRILPGAHAREYECHAQVPWISHLDVVYAFATFLLASAWKPPVKIYWPLVVVFWLWMKSRIVTKESILAIKDVGVQVRTVYWGGRSVSRFIDQHKIRDIVINEGITMWQIKSYMAILLSQEDKMVVVFEHLLPQLRPTLLKVYTGTRDVISPSSSDNASM